MNNPVFPDRQIIHIEQTASTNSYLLQLSNAQKLAEGTVVVTDNQTRGRGQGNNSWESEPGKNLTFSVILYPVSVEASRQFILSKAISLAVYDFLSQFVTDNQTQGRGQGNNSWESAPGKNLTFSMILYPVSIEVSAQFVLSKAISLAVYDFISQFVSDVSVKYPNDVYVGNRKITGILIENFIKGAYLEKSIAGIGVNINQERFESNAPNPVSLRQMTGNTYQLNDCLENLCACIAHRYKMITGNADQLHSDYEQHLYR
jgi:biotin-[acetyl-CoA-carboxylase] ligase BirA-like protein